MFVEEPNQILNAGDTWHANLDSSYLKAVDDVIPKPQGISTTRMISNQSDQTSRSVKSSLQFNQNQSPSCVFLN